MNNMTTFYIVRHGQTDWNAQRLLQGHSGSSLNTEGRAQIANLAAEFKSLHFDLVFSSDLLRAKETAEIIAREHDLTVATTKLLRERAFGNFEGKPYEALSAYDTYFETLSEEKKKQYKSGEDVESDWEMIERFIRFLRETAITHPGKAILVATHGGMMKALVIHLGMTTYEKMGFGGIPNGSYIRLESDGADFFVKETKGITLNN